MLKDTLQELANNAFPSTKNSVNKLFIESLVTKELIQSAFDRYYATPFFILDTGDGYALMIKETVYDMTGITGDEIMGFIQDFCKSNNLNINRQAKYWVILWD